MLWIGPQVGLVSDSLPQVLQREGSLGIAPGPLAPLGPSTEPTSFDDPRSHPPEGILDACDYEALYGTRFETSRYSVGDSDADLGDIYGSTPILREEPELLVDEAPLPNTSSQNLHAGKS